MRIKGSEQTEELQSFLASMGLGHLIGRTFDLDDEAYLRHFDGAMAGHNNESEETRRNRAICRTAYDSLRKEGVSEVEKEEASEQPVNFFRKFLEYVGVVKPTAEKIADEAGKLTSELQGLRQDLRSIPRSPTVVAPAASWRPSRWDKVWQWAIIALLAALLFAVSADAQHTIVVGEDEGVHVITRTGGSIIINCVGAGISCTPLVGGKFTITVSGAGGGAPVGSEYLVLTLDPTLTGERRYIAGIGIGSVDGGADGDYTISLDLSELVANQTMFDGGQATQTITFSLSGASDPVLSLADGTFDISTGTLQEGGVDAVILTKTQAPTNKTLDGGVATTTHAAGANFFKIVRHATDCTAITDGSYGEPCWEIDADTIYLCENAAGCTVPGDWVAHATGAGAHDILSATHSDTTPATVVRGDIMVGQTATPLWQRLGLGGNNLYLKSNTTDLIYSTLAAAGVGACAANQFADTLNADAVPGCSQVDFTNLSGSATLAQLPFGAANQLLGTNATPDAIEHKSLASDETGTDFGITHTAGVITFNWPIASATNTGKLSSTDWGTFDGSVDSVSGGNGITSSGGETPSIAVDLLAVQDGSGSTFSFSGLEMQGTGSDKLTMLQGCADGQIQKWDDEAGGNGRWDCANDNDSGGSTPWEDLVNTADSSTDYTSNNAAEVVNWGWNSAYAATLFSLDAADTGNTALSLGLFDFDSTATSLTRTELNALETIARHSGVGGTTTELAGLRVSTNTNPGGTVTRNYGLRAESQDGVGATENWNIYSGTVVTSFDASVQFVLDDAANAFGFRVPSADKFQAVGVVIEDTGSTNDLIGIYSAVSSANATGTRATSTAIEADVYHVAAGTNTLAVGLGTYIQADAGTISTGVGGVFYTPFENGGTIANAIGINIQNQNGAAPVTNSLALRSDGGIFQIGLDDPAQDFIVHDGTASLGTVLFRVPGDTQGACFGPNEDACAVRTGVGILDITDVVDANVGFRVAGAAAATNILSCNGTNCIAQQLQDTQIAAGAVDGGSGGEIADGTVDSNDLATANKTFDKSISIINPTTALDDDIQWMHGKAVTYTDVDCSCDTGTLTIDMDHRVITTPNTTGTDILTGTIVCDTNNQSDGGFADATIPANVPVNLSITADSGTPGGCRIHIRGTVD